jgi:hypothetical protein
MKEIQAYNQWRTYRHKKESFKIKQEKAAAIIASTLNVPMTTTFLVNHPTNVNTNDPKQLFDYIDEYFLQNSAVIVSRLQSELKNITRNDNEKADDIAKRMKTILNHRAQLKVVESEQSTKEILINAYREVPFNHPAFQSLQNIVINTVSAPDYETLSFDELAQKLYNLELYIKLPKIETKQIKAAIQTAKEPTITPPSQVTFEQANSLKDLERHLRNSNNQYRGKSSQLRSTSKKNNRKSQNDKSDKGNSKRKQSDSQPQESSNKRSKAHWKTQCFTCKGFGHIADVCPSPTTEDDGSSSADDAA